MHNTFETLRWQNGPDGNEAYGYLVLLDQTRLPGEIVELECKTVEDVWHAIRRLSVRGAPAIGCAAAYGVCLSEPNRDAIEQACDHLATSRPTAVNLFWALERMRQRAATCPPADLAVQLLTEAKAIHDEDRQMCADIGRQGANLLRDLPDGCGILTHCNAGALATGGDGTALSVIFELARRRKQPHVWVDETRPLLQGARLTSWELMQRDIDCTLICDSMAAQVMSEGRVQAIITGADRIAANGDAANKIGTHGVAILASHFNIPFFIAAPTSTIDPTLPNGDQIPIEQRESAEITHGFGSVTAPEKVSTYNPAFDVTPNELIRAIVTENGVWNPQ